MGRCERYFKNESDMIRFGGWIEGLGQLTGDN